MIAEGTEGGDALAVHVCGEAVGGFVVVVDADVGFVGVRAVEASGVLDDAALEGDGRREEERVEAREVETFAEERRGGEEGEALAGVGEGAPAL